MIDRPQADDLPGVDQAPFGLGEALHGREIHRAGVEDQRLPLHLVVRAVAQPVGMAGEVAQVAVAGAVQEHLGGHSGGLALAHRVDCVDAAAFAFDEGHLRVQANVRLRREGNPQRFASGGIGVVGRTVLRVGRRVDGVARLLEPTKEFLEVARHHGRAAVGDAVGRDQTQGHVAAQGERLFEQHGAHSQSSRGGRCRHAGGASAHDADIGLDQGGAGVRRHRPRACGRHGRGFGVERDGRGRRARLGGRGDAPNGARTGTHRTRIACDGDGRGRRAARCAPTQEHPGPGCGDQPQEAPPRPGAAEGRLVGLRGAGSGLGSRVVVWCHRMGVVQDWATLWAAAARSGEKQIDSRGECRCPL